MGSVAPAHTKPNQPAIGAVDDNLSRSKYTAIIMAKLLAKIPVMLKGAVDAASPRLATFGKYAAVELTPPSPAELGGVASGLGNIVKSAQSGGWKNLTTKEAALNTLVAIEVVCWFYIGECIGKRAIVGYHV